MGPKKQKDTKRGSSPEAEVAQAILDNNVDQIGLIVSNAPQHKRNALLGAGLCTSCKRGNLKAARYLLDLGADVNHLATRRHGYGSNEKRLPPLLIAVQNDHQSIIQLLLDRGADVNIKNDFGRTALMICKSSETIKILHLGGANLEAQDNKGSTALMVALMERRDLDVWKLLLKCGADIHAVDKQGRTALMTAAWKGNVEAIQDLLSRGIDIKKKDGRGRSILHHLAIDQQLADEAHSDEHKKKCGLTGLFRKEVVEPIFKASVEWNALDHSKRTCLHWAAMIGSSQLADMMLEVGKVDVNAKDHRGRCALHLAASRNNLRTLEVLLRRGAHPNILGDGSWTPLHVACNSDPTSHKAIKLLVDHGADPNLITDKNQSPLHIAARAGNTHAVDYLIQLPANKSSTREVLRKSMSLCAAHLKDIHPETRKSVLRHVAPWSTVPELPQYARDASERSFATVAQFGRPWKRNDRNIRTHSVYDLIYKADPKDASLPATFLLPSTGKDKPGNKNNDLGQTPPSEFRWVHLPANNVSWCHDLIQKYFLEAETADSQSFKDWERSFHHQRQGQQLHSRFMNPVCRRAMQSNRPQSQTRQGSLQPGLDTVFARIRQTSNTDLFSSLSGGPFGEPEDNLDDQFKASPRHLATPVQQEHVSADIPVEDVKKFGSMYLFLPYLHFETYKEREEMQDAAERVREAQDAADRVAQSHFYQSQSSGQVELGESCFRGYLHDETGSLHMRRTLDQFMYHNISTRQRDRDQVVQRYQTNSGKERDQHILLMVDQLWMWILSDDFIVTAFPQKWRPGKDGIGDVHENIIRYVRENRSDLVGNVFELAMIIASQCLGAYDVPGGVYDSCKFLHVFDAWIGENVQKEINLFNCFTKDSQEVSRWLRDPRKFRELQDLQKLRRSKSRWRSVRSRSKEAGPQEASFLDNLIDVNKETALLKEFMDIRDELDMLSLVFQQQAKLLPTLTSLMSTFCTEFNVASASRQRIGRIIEDQRRVIHHPQDDIKRMQAQVGQTYRSLRDLLDLKQQHANAIEARYAREQTEGTSRQGQTLMVFTVVTVIFLPLSFIAAFFTIEVAEFPHVDGGQEMSLAFVSKFLFGIGIPLAIFCVFIAMKTEYIADQFRNIHDWIFGRDPAHAAGQLLPAAKHLSAHALSMAAPGADINKVMIKFRRKGEEDEEDLESGTMG